MNSATPERYWGLTNLERDVLVAAASLDDGQPSGQDIKQRVASLRGQKQPTDANTYAALDRLAEWGLTEQTEIDGRTTGHVVTDDGLDLLSDAISEWPT